MYICVSIYLNICSTALPPHCSRPPLTLGLCLESRFRSIWEN